MFENALQCIDFGQEPLFYVAVTAGNSSGSRGYSILNILSSMKACSS